MEDKIIVKNVAAQIIISIEETIYIAYQNLKRCEIEYGPDSAEYEKTLLSLYKLKEKENHLYEYFEKNPAAAIELIMSIINIDNQIEKNAIFAILNSRKNERILFRIINRLKPICRLHDSYFNLEIGDNIKYAILDDNADEAKRYLREFLPLFESNLYKTFLLLFSDKLGFDTDSAEYLLSEDIASLKYDLCFLDTNIENYHLFAGFDKKLDLDIKTSLKPKTKASITNALAIEICYNAADEILTYCDYDLEDEVSIQSIQYFANMLKSALSFLDQNGLNDFKELLAQRYLTEEYLEDYAEDLEIKDLVENIVLRYQEYRKFANRDPKNKQKP